MIHKKPRKGDRIFYQGEFTGNVLKVDGNICILDTIIEGAEYKEHNRFIWRFVENGKEVFNNMHSIGSE